MKICHVITRMIIGGAQENTLLTCQGHLEKGYDVTLVTGPSPGPEGELLKQGCPKGLRVITMPQLIRSISPLQDWQAVRELEKLFRDERFDVVHTHASKAGIVGRMAAWSAKTPFVVHTVHGLPFHAYQNPLINQLYIHIERFAAKRCHKIYAVAQAMIDQCIQARIAPASQFKVVYSGMHLESFMNARPEDALRARLGIPQGVPVIGKVARLFELKGHDDVLAVASELVKTHPDLRVLLVGDGILRPQLEAEARQRGLEKNIVFAGLVPPADVCRYIALMDVLIHFSLREGLPRSVVQGLAAGKPVVAFPLDGTPEVVLDGKTGFLRPPHDIGGLAEAIRFLLDHPSERQAMGEAGRQNVSRLFDWRRMADILEEEYRAGLNAAH